MVTEDTGRIGGGEGSAARRHASAHTPRRCFHHRRRGTGEVHFHGVRQGVPPRLELIRYEIMLDTDESDARLELLHQNVTKYGTVFNTIVPGTSVEGRASPRYA